MDNEPDKKEIVVLIVEDVEYGRSLVGDGRVTYAAILPESIRDEVAKVLDRVQEENL